LNKNYEYQQTKNKTRICPDCGIRELEKGCMYCSECAENRVYFSKLIYSEEFKSKNPEKYKEYKRNWYIKNKDEHIKNCQQYYQDHIEEIRQYKKGYSKKYYKDNKEKIEVRRKKWEKENVGHNKEYYKDHKEYYRRKNRDYYLNITKPKNELKKLMGN